MRFLSVNRHYCARKAINCASDQTMREIAKLSVVALRKSFGFSELRRRQTISSSNARQRRRRQRCCSGTATLPAVWLELNVEFHDRFERSSAINTRTQIRKQTCETQQPAFEVNPYRSLASGRLCQRIDAG